jgi:peptidoglycan/LPS O-acetylase OafA/YrhL
MAATGSEPAAAGRAAGEAAAPPAGAVRQAGEQRNARVESLRAIGALGVIVSHIFVGALALKGLGGDYTGAYKDRLLINAGYLGLYLFFALSGYLLYLPFARHQLQGRPIDVRVYARNRALRILPLYFSAIAFLLIVYPFNVDRSEWWRFALLIQNYSPETINRLNAPLWTISVEIQYYIALPLLAWVIAKLAGSSLRRSALLLVGIGVASYALRLHEVVSSPEPNIFGILGKYALPTNLYGFVVGMLIALARIAWERRTPGWAARPIVGSTGAWIGAGIVLFLLTAYNLDLQEPWLALAAFSILAASVLPLRGGRLLRALEWRPLATLGIATFSLYVWHAPVLLGVVQTTDIKDFKALFLIGMPLCIAGGVLSYNLIERPALRRRKGWGATAAVPPPEPEIRSDDR